MAPTNEGAAARDLVVFRVGEMRCGLDIGEIQEIKRVTGITTVHRAPDYVRGLVNMRGQVVTLVDVRDRLGLGARESTGTAPAIIVQHGGDLVGLLVDAVDDVVSDEPEARRPPPPNLGGAESGFFTAVLEMPDGLIAVLDKARVAGLEASVRPGVTGG